MDNSIEAPLAGRTIGITADRRWQEQADLFRRRGAAVLHGPTLRTVDLSDAGPLRSATEALLDRRPDYVVATTGMGMRMWLAAAESWGVEARLLDILGRARVIARGAKSASAVKGAGLEVWWQAPSERMDDIVQHLAGQDLSAARVALQLFDPSGQESADRLRQLAGELIEVPVYRWLLPDDAAPAHRLIDAVLAGEVAAVTFTAQPAVHHLFRLAGDNAGPLRDALNGAVLCVCVGPVCAEAAREEGITAPLWPEPARLPAMVRLATEQLTGSPC